MTLSRRLQRVFLLYAIGIFSLFSTLTIVSLFILEDGFFDRTLKVQAQQLRHLPVLPDAPRELAPHIMFYPDILMSPFADLTLAGDDKYEVSRQQQYFHLRTLQVENGKLPLLAFNVTQRLLVTQSMDDLAIIFAPILMLLLLSTWLLTRLLVKSTLRPFNQLVEAVAQGKDHAELLELGENLQEQDIKSLLHNLANSWHQKEQLLQDKIVFNQGISHELRTPLQVAKHATELLKSEDDISQRAQQRLVKSLQKMENISQAFLWISSENQWQQAVNVVPLLTTVTAQLQDVARKRHMQIRTTVTEDCIFNAPNEVLHVLLENLLLNALNHSVDSNIEIHCNAQQLSISNHYNAELPSDGFGIGMLLVKHITERFDIQWQQTSHGTVYVVTLYCNCA